MLNNRDIPITAGWFFCSSWAIRNHYSAMTLIEDLQEKGWFLFWDFLLKSEFWNGCSRLLGRHRSAPNFALRAGRSCIASTLCLGFALCTVAIPKSFASPGRACWAMRQGDLARALFSSSGGLNSCPGFTWSFAGILMIGTMIHDHVDGANGVNKSNMIHRYL